MIFLVFKEKGRHPLSESKEVRITGIWHTVYINVLPAIRMHTMGLWTLNSGYCDKENIWVSISYNFQPASTETFLAKSDNVTRYVITILH